jgi:hypothetical protein
MTLGLKHGAPSRAEPGAVAPLATLKHRLCSSLLVHLKDVLKDICLVKFTKEVLFLHDNALAHRPLATQKKLAYVGFHCLDHPSYSLDLVPSNYHLLPGLKKQLKGSHFSSDMKSHCCCGDLVGQTTF